MLQDSNSTSLDHLLIVPTRDIVRIRNLSAPVHFQIRFRIIEYLPTRMPDVEHLFVVYFERAFDSDVGETP